MGWGWPLGTLGPRVAGQGRLLLLPFTQVSFPCGFSPAPAAHPPCRPLPLSEGPPGYLQGKDHLEALASFVPWGAGAGAGQSALGKRGLGYGEPPLPSGRLSHFSMRSMAYTARDEG